jgi:hypothetical protein
LAFRFFTTYPIQDYFQTADEDALLDKDYRLMVGAKSYDALNLAIVHQKRGFIASLPLHVDLKQNLLTLIPQSKAAPINIHNLYGEDSNTKWIELQINLLKIVQLSNLNQLYSIYHKVVIDKNCQKAFEDLMQNQQKAVLEHFERAKKRNLPTPFAADGTLIKHVSSEKTTVYELRIRHQPEFRVYFQETPEVLYLAKIGWKAGSEQDSDIKNAAVILRKWLN